MKKTGKKIFALLLALMMLACAIPFSAAAEEEFSLKFRFIKENYNPNTQKYDDTYAWVDGYSGTPVGELTIPDEAEGCPVVGVWYNTFKGADKITKINFGQNMHYILESAFEGCTGITELTIPGRIMTIEKKAFLGCSSIKNLVLEEGVTYVDEAVFKDCISLETAVLPESLERINSFENCSSLKSIVIPSQITDINGFAGCSSLESVTLPETARTIRCYAFKGCSSLKSIVIPESVRYFEFESFEDCTALADITLLSSWLWKLGSDIFYNTAFYNNEDNWENGVLYINEFVFSAKKDLSGKVVIRDNTTDLADRAFQGCTEITEIIFPESFHGIGWESLEGCTSLESVTFLSDSVSIDQFGFQNCSSLKKLEIPKFSGYSLNNSFYGCSSLESITVVNEGYGITSVDGVLFSNDGKKLEYCPEGKLGRTYKIPDGVEWINDNAFYKNQKIENLVIPESVTTIEDHAFQRMKSLKKFNIPKAITTIPMYAFSGCTALEWVAIPDHVTEIGAGAFEECSSLRYIRLPEGLTTIGSSAFYKCPELKKIAIPESVNEIEGTRALGLLQYEPYMPVIYTDGFTIYGYSNSTAEKYAKENKLAFADISLFVDEPEPDWDFSEPEPDVPDEPPVDPSENCPCRCHKDGFQGFIYKIFRIFWKIFKTNEDCACGAKHY